MIFNGMSCCRSDFDLKSMFTSVTTIVPLLIILFSFTAFPLQAQYNEREILNQQASQLLVQRQYTQAEQLYKTILDKYPNDLNAILQLLNIYFSLSQNDKAETLLTQYQRQIPAQTYSEQHIQLLVMKAEINDAWRESNAYLELYGYDEYKYRRLASLFERKAFYEQVLELYRQGRNKLNNPDLFRLEIANTSMNYRLFSDAIREYLAYLDKNPVNLFFTNNQLKTILQEDSILISVVKAFADSSSSQSVKEAYANALVSQKDFSTALNIYKQLELSKLARFADEQSAAGNEGIAFSAYAYLDSLEKDPVKQADLRYRMAGIKYREAAYPATIGILQSALDLPFWKDRNWSYRSLVGVKLRKLRAETSLAMGEPADSAKKWLQEAKSFARDQLEQQEMDLEIARLMIMDGDSTGAQKILATVNQAKHSELKEYLGFVSALFDGNVSLADTLMNTFVIRYPASPYTNDTIYLMMLTLGLEGSDQGSFFTAVRLLQLNRKAGLDTLEVIIAHTGDEELRLLAAEWAIGFSDYNRAKAFLASEFSDPVAADYASLLSLAIVNSKEEEQNLAREFLKNKPNSIFSPGFRQRISRLNSTKPNL